MSPFGNAACCPQTVHIHSDMTLGMNEKCSLLHPSSFSTTLCGQVDVVSSIQNCIQSACNNTTCAKGCQQRHRQKKLCAGKRCLKTENGNVDRDHFAPDFGVASWMLVRELIMKQTFQVNAPHQHRLTHYRGNTQTLEMDLHRLTDCSDRAMVTATNRLLDEHLENCLIHLALLKAENLLTNTNMHTQTPNRTHDWVPFHPQPTAGDE